jgi:hypothetical protein
VQVKSRNNTCRLARAQRAEAYSKRIVWFSLAVICVFAFYKFYSKQMPLQSAVSIMLSFGFFYIAAWCMPLERKFPDSLRVRSSSSGTQSVSPIEILLQDSAFSDLELCNRLYTENPNCGSRSFLKIEWYCKSESISPPLVGRLHFRQPLERIEIFYPPGWRLPNPVSLISRRDLSTRNHAHHHRSLN